jgi:S1-C subfamily serine protease
MHFQRTVYALADVLVAMAVGVGTAVLFRTQAGQPGRRVHHHPDRHAVVRSDGVGERDFFRRCFSGPLGPSPQVHRAIGSGFLISLDGKILTNNRVVAGADQIREGCLFAATEGRFHDMLQTDASIDPDNSVR